MLAGGSFVFWIGQAAAVAGLLAFLRREERSRYLTGHCALSVRAVRK